MHRQHVPGAGGGAGMPVPMPIRPSPGGRPETIVPRSPLGAGVGAGVGRRTLFDARGDSGSGGSSGSMDEGVGAGRAYRAPPLHQPQRHSRRERPQARAAYEEDSGDEDVRARGLIRHGEYDAGHGRGREHEEEEEEDVLDPFNSSALADAHAAPDFAFATVVPPRSSNSGAGTTPPARSGFGFVGSGHRRGLSGGCWERRRRWRWRAAHAEQHAGAEHEEPVPHEHARVRRGERGVCLWMGCLCGVGGVRRRDVACGRGIACGRAGECGSGRECRSGDECGACRRRKRQRVGVRGVHGGERRRAHATAAAARSGGRCAERRRGEHAWAGEWVLQLVQRLCRSSAAPASAMWRAVYGPCSTFARPFISIPSPLSPFPPLHLSACPSSRGLFSCAMNLPAALDPLNQVSTRNNFHILSFSLSDQYLQLQSSAPSCHTVPYAPRPAAWRACNQHLGFSLNLFFSGFIALLLSCVLFLAACSLRVYLHDITNAIPAPDQATYILFSPTKIWTIDYTFCTWVDYLPVPSLSISQCMSPACAALSNTLRGLPHTALRASSVVHLAA